MMTSLLLNLFHIYNVRIFSPFQKLISNIIIQKWDSLKLIINNDTIVYIPYNKEYANYRIEDILRRHYPLLNFKFYVLEINTRGAAETINIALKQLNISDQPIISIDSDNFYIWDIKLIWNNCLN